MVCIDVLPLAV